MRGKRKRGPVPGVFTQVNLRLFTEDVALLKREAKAAGEAEWQPRLRRLVHNAVRSKGVLR
jgi:murein endopeptidase